MSGLGAPVRTPSPTRDCITLALLPAAIRPSLTSSLIVSSPATMRSILAPSLTSLMIAGAALMLSLMVWPLVFSNIGLSTPMTSGNGPPVATTLISAALTLPARAVRQSAVASAVSFDLARIMSSLGLTCCCERSSNSLSLSRIETLGFQHRARSRRFQELDECLAGRALATRGAHGRYVGRHQLQLCRKWADELDAFDREKLADLLNCELGLALDYEFREHAARERLALGLHFVGNAEPLADRDEMNAARSHRGIGDRLGVEHRALEGLDCADVGLLCALARRNADARICDVVPR